MKQINIVAKLIGGIWKYCVNAKSNKNDYKLKTGQKRTEDILIPLCANIEDLTMYLLEATTLVNLKRDKGFVKRSSNCTQFLKVDKRVYLNKYSRELLYSYDEHLARFNDWLDLLVEEIISVIETDMKGILGKYTTFMGVGLGFTDSSRETIEKAILEFKDIDSELLISGVTFMNNDDIDNPDVTSVYLGEKFYSEVWEPINSGYREFENSDFSPEEEMSIDLMRFITNHCHGINSKINKHTKRNKVGYMYRDILNLLGRIGKHLSNEIDKITDL